IAGSALAGHRDRPRRNLAAASALRRFGRPSAHRARRPLPSPRRPQGAPERTVDRGYRCLRAQRRPRDREPGRSAADFWGKTLIRPTVIASEAKQSISPRKESVDCFVASLLAMTE